MGLYSLACTALSENAHEYIDSLFTDFYGTANESRLAAFGIFFPAGSDFKIILNKGFNAETVRKSVSTRDFWDGMIRDDGWHFIRGAALNPFYQLFSAYDAAFDCLSIKKASHKDSPFIFAAAGEFSDVFLQKQLDSFMPFIERTYTVLQSFYKPSALLLREIDDFIVQAKEHFKSVNASLYTVKLNKLFESLFALLGPSDFDFITSCIGAAAVQPGTAAPLCFVSDEESSLYILTQDKENRDFCASMKKDFEKMFSQKRADFMKSEPASPDSSLYKQLSQEITLTQALNR